MIEEFRRSRAGSVQIEYAMIASLIALVVFASVGVVGNKIGNTFVRLSNAMPESP